MIFHLLWSLIMIIYFSDVEKTFYLLDLIYKTLLFYLYHNFLLEKIVPYVYNALKYSNFILKHL